VVAALIAAMIADEIGTPHPVQQLYPTLAS
jgi:hypothetical protein